MSRASLVLVLGFLLGGSRTAAAQTIAIVELSFADIPPAVADLIRLRVRDELQVQGYQVLEEDSAKRQLRDAAPGCKVGPCLARVGRALRVDRVILGAIAAHGTSSYELTLSLLETGGGTVVAQVSQRCDVCNFKEVQTSAARAVVSLNQQARAAIALRALLAVSSVPPAAEIAIDGLQYGGAPVRALLPPGDHTVEASLRDGLPLRRELKLRAGESRSLTLNLRERRDEQRIVQQAPSSKKRRYPSWVKWVLLGGGVTLISPGAVLWAVDGRPTVDERNLVDTRPAGIALVSLGGAAVLTGAVLWILERR